MKELWEKINLSAIVSLLVLLAGAVSGLIAVYFQYKGDRNRLKVGEAERQGIRDDIINMKAEIKKNRDESNESIKELILMIHSSNETMVSKVDDLKTYLLHSKITIKGIDYEKNNGR